MPVNDRHFMICNRMSGRVVYQGHNKAYADNCWARVQFDPRLSYYEFDRETVDRSDKEKAA